MASLKHGGKIVATIGPGQRALDLAIDTGRKPLDLTPLANTKLTSIIIRFTENGDLPTVKLPPSMPALRTLVVSGKISNWKVLGAYTGLEKLDAGVFTEVTSIDWLAGLTKLRDLEIDVGAAKSVDVIADLPLLERLDLRGYA